MREGVELQSVGITGVQVNYYFICKTKLWLFSHNTQMEHSSDTVAIGKTIHAESYHRNKREINLGSIKVDFYKRGNEIILHEVKKSKKMERSHKYQLLYYIYYLKRLGIDAKGVINYPLLRRTEKVTLTQEDVRVLEAALHDISKIVSLEGPPKPKKKNYCRKCSYFEYCWVR
jgi:CRISPR-associated exonuclease Cas4